MKRVAIYIPIALVLLIGFWLRWSHLDRDPLQFDEGVNWYLATQPTGDRSVTYDPSHFHGPLFFRLLSATGLDSEVALRIPGIIAGMVLIVIATAVCLGGGSGSSYFAATMVGALLALDPLSRFYNGVAIHENWFTAVALSVIITIHAWWRYPTALRAIFCGCAIGILASIKETFPLPVVASLLALYSTEQSIRWSSLARTTPLILVGWFVGCGIGFGSFDGSALVIHGLSQWLTKGLRDASQYQPWWYYLAVISTSSPLTVAAPILWRRADQKARYFILVGLIMLLGYSAIPYKTPWLMLSAIPPLLIGISLSQSRKWLAILATISLPFLMHPWATEHLESNNSDPGVRDVAHITLQSCASFGASCRVFVGVPWYWPLPFYLRSLGEQVTYANQPVPLATSQFHVLILPLEASQQILDWSRTEHRLSRVQSVSVYRKTALYNK